MGMTIDDMYDWLYRLKSELVTYMPKEWHEPMRCSIQDAITFSRKYQMFKAEYENRLKADMVAMLEDLDLRIDEFDSGCGWDGYIKKIDIHELIQQKIDKLKENKKWK